MASPLLMPLPIGMPFSSSYLKCYPYLKADFTVFSIQETYSHFSTQICSLSIELLKHGLLFVLFSQKQIPLHWSFLYCIISNLRKQDCVILNTYVYTHRQITWHI